MAWDFKFGASKLQKRLDEIQTNIHDQSVALLNAQLNAARAKAQLDVLLAAEAELLQQIPPAPPKPELKGV